MEVNMNEPGIYDDLNSDLGEKVLKLQQQNNNLHDHIEILEKDVHKLCNELIQMKKIEENLKRNISELYKTAKTEIARKDRMIVELRSELDNLLFRRKNRSISDTSGKVEVTFSNKRSSVDVHADEPISSKRIKCEPINKTSIKENDIPHVKSSDNNKDRLSRSRSNSVYSHAGSVEGDHDNDRGRYISNNKQNVKSHKRDRNGSSKQEHTKSRSRSKERDRFHRSKEKPRSRTRSRDRGKLYSSSKESSHRHFKSSYKRDSDYYDKNSTRHVDKHHSSLKDENKLISGRQDRSDKKVSESKQDKSCKNTSSSSKSFASFRRVGENVDNLKADATSDKKLDIRTGIVTELDTHKIAPENQNEIDRGQTIKNGDVDHIHHLENLNNKEVIVKLYENNLCKDKDFIIADNPRVSKDPSDLQLTNLDNNNTANIPSGKKEESVKSEENQNDRIITTNAVNKNVSETLDASCNDTINNSGMSTDGSPDTEGVNLGQNQSDRIKVNSRRRRCVIKVMN